MQLASRFASRSPSLRSDYPLSDDQIHRVAPSIFADAPHERPFRWTKGFPLVVLAVGSSPSVGRWTRR